MSRHDNSQMKGWTFLTGDVSWEGYGAKWAKKCRRDGAWFVLVFENMYDCCGEDDCRRDGQEQYICDVKRLHLGEIPDDELTSALKYYGYRLEDAGVVNEHDSEMVAARDADHFELVLVECCLSYGLGAPLDSESGDHRPVNIRARARKIAEGYMRDAERLETALDRPVNAIGSTAREYGCGDVSAAMSRLRIADERKVQFGTLHADGTVTDIRYLNHSDMRKCSFAIMVTEHYRADGSCKCDDAEHRKLMISEWGYMETSFANIPLRKGT